MSNISSTRFRFSNYTSLIQVHDRWIIANGVYLQRVVLDSSLAQLCLKLRQSPLTQEDFRHICPHPMDGDRLFRFLKERQLIVPEETDEGGSLQSLISDFVQYDPNLMLQQENSSWPETHYWQPQQLSTHDFEQRSMLPGSQAPQNLRVLLIGGCVLQFLEDTFVHVGLQRGFDVFLRHHWPSRPDGLETLVQSWDPQITIFQPTVQSMMSALWDFGAFEDHSERQRHLKLIKTALSTYIVDLAELLEPRLGLVHNFAPPAVSPFGHLDFRMPVNFRQIVAEINHHLDELVQQYSHLMLLDEERLTTQYGSSVLFDDLLFPFGHHGGKPDPLINIPHQLPLLSRALVHEYLNIYEIYHGINRIKCIAVDLDDVLWPGIVADEGFAWLDSDLTNRWIHLGIHQALQLMKSRGILLASCSKGTQEATFAVWQQAQHPMLLKPDDFVLHKINWEQKSVNILQICHTLDIAPEQVLFLDDNPTERSEVHQRLPGIRIPDIPVHEFRRFLLTASCCEVSHITREANERTITTKAVLARKSLAENASSESFLASLRVQLTIGRATVQELPRVAELFNRTNQFNTTMLRTTPTELADWLQDPKVAIFVVSVTDCFVDYGLVGACIIHTNTIKGLAISCRVIGLEIALPFLLTCLSESGCMQPGTCGLTVQTERNTPAQDIYLRAGFEEVRVGEYIVKNVSALVSLKDFPHQVKVGSPFDNTHQKRSNE